MIHKVEATDHTIISCASILAHTPEGKEVMLIIEGPFVAGAAPSHHDKQLITAVRKKYKPLESECIFLWVSPPYLFGERITRPYDPESNTWLERVNNDIISDLRTKGGADVNVMINDCIDQLSRAEQDSR